MTRIRGRNDAQRAAAYARLDRRRKATSENPTTGGSVERSQRTALGLELLMLCAKPGVPLTDDDIACWMGVTPEAVAATVRGALRHANQIIRYHDDGKLFEELKP